jgi:hypothetical protein
MNKTFSVHASTDCGPGLIGLSRRAADICNVLSKRGIVVTKFGRNFIVHYYKPSHETIIHILMGEHCNGFHVEEFEKGQGNG